MNNIVNNSCWQLHNRNGFRKFPLFYLVLEIEGIRIGQLSHSETYVSKNDSEDGEQGGDDHYILRKLFKKSGEY